MRFYESQHFLGRFKIKLKEELHSVRVLPQIQAWGRYTVLICRMQEANELRGAQWTGTEIISHSYDNINKCGLKSSNLVYL